MEVVFNSHYPDVFAVANSNACFYRLSAEGFNKEDEAIAPQLFMTKDSDVNADVRHMAWHPSLELCDVIAVGQSNGRVSLISTNFLESGRNKGMIAREFVPKHSRSCSSLSWNESSSHLLAIGLEKSRSGSLVIWDINSKTQPSSEKHKVSSELNPSPNSQSVKPMFETAPGESVNSLVWLSDSCLIAGFNKKYMRLYDIRSLSNTFSVVNYKETYGLCVDPNRDTRFACFGENRILVWDYRNYQKPVANFATSNIISNIEWSRVRSGMLGSLFATNQEGVRHVGDNTTLHIYDMLNATYTDNDYQVGNYQPILRTVRPTIPEGDWISGFAWIPQLQSSELHLQNNTLLTVSNLNSFNFVCVPESSCLSWSGRNNFTVACGYHTTLCTQREAETKTTEKQYEDTTSLMYDRVLNGYGISDDNFLKNIELSLLPNNQGVHVLWRFIDIIKKALIPPTVVRAQMQQSPSHWSRSRSITSQKSVKLKSPPFYTGVQNILKDDSEEYGSTVTETIPWIGVDNTKSKIFTSEKRNLALMLCDWGNVDNDGRREGNRFGRNSFGEDLVRRLQKCGATERACAIAVWHLDIKLAIEILNLSLKSQKSSKYSAVAMALSGFTGSNCPTLWLDTCRQLQNELQNAYLQMAFAFLIACAEDSQNVSPVEKFDVILANVNILLQDRVAFACMYLPDLVLNTFINSLADDLVAKGDLEGIPVVGLSTPFGIGLLQNYLNETRDIQTPLLAVIHTHESKLLLENPHIQHWKDSYRNLLNKWKLYFHRTDLDLLWNKACSVQVTSSQVYLHCNYCNKSISHSFQSSTHKGPVVVESGRPTDKAHLKFGRDVSPPVYGASPRSALMFSSERALCVRLYRDDLLESGLDSARPHRIHSPNPAAGSPKGRGFGGGINQQSTITSCPFCRKPLPRCSVCSMLLGTRQDETDFTKWITWCMKCRHGGHQGHLKDWFETHKMCPVTDCKCFCNDDLPVS